MLRLRPALIAAALSATAAPAQFGPGGYPQTAYPPAGAGAAGYPQNGYGGGYGGPATPYGAGGLPAAGVLPNFYNRQYQPLSPYLNLNRGGNPAVNYFYGVRPGLQSSGLYQGGLPGGGGFGGYSQLQSGFLPLAAVPTATPVLVGPVGVEVPAFASTGLPATYSTGPTRLGQTGNPGGYLGQPAARQRPAAKK